MNQKLSSVTLVENLHDQSHVSFVIFTNPHDWAPIQNKPNNLRGRARSCKTLYQMLYEAPTAIYLRQSLCPVFCLCMIEGEIAQPLPPCLPQAQHPVVWSNLRLSSKICLTFLPSWWSTLNHYPFSFAFLLFSSWSIMAPASRASPLFLFTSKLQSHGDKMWQKISGMTNPVYKNIDTGTIALLSTTLFPKEVKKYSEFLSRLKRLFSPL